jgi:DNA-directed RNA polymerase subunit RPC12/RpoP
MPRLNAIVPLNPRIEPRKKRGGLYEDAPRCPRCGKRISAKMSVCSACGHELVAHRSRIRCVHCKSRIPADAVKCPRCGANPRASRHIPRAVSVGALIAVALLLLSCLSWVGYRAVTTNVLARALSSLAPTRTPTQVIQYVIYVIATPVPPTPTFTPTATLTATPRASPTPTLRSSGQAQRTVRATATTLVPATPALSFYPAPQLTAPLDRTVYTGANSIIALEWQPLAGASLQENEWYMISITYTARDGRPTVQTRWSKETRWTVPNVWWNEASKDARMFKWNVSVMRIQGIDPFTSPSHTPASPNSVTRTFYWH